MENINNYLMSIVSTNIFCIFIIGNPQVAAEENEWARTGDLLKQEGNYNEAITAYNKALQIDPENKQAWVNKGDALNNLGNYNEAITAYNKALQIDPYYVNTWDGIGRSLNGLGDYTQAISYLDKAIEIDPKNIDALISKHSTI